MIEEILNAIEAKERHARRATAGPWRYNPLKAWHDPEERDKPPHLRKRPEEFVAAGPRDAAICIASTGPAGHRQSMSDAAFIADNDPAGVLGRCAVDRAVLARHRSQRNSGVLLGVACAWCHRDDRPVPYPCPDLLDLASAYGVQPGQPIRNRGVTNR